MLSVRTSVGSPPLSATRMSPIPPARMKTIFPSSSQAIPGKAETFSASVVAVPPTTGCFLS